MGWEVIPWYTLTDDFDADFDVAEWHGTNVFFREDDQIFRTYFVDGRGDEALGGLWAYLDITPLGRQEEWEDSPEGYPQSQDGWVRRHDEYDVSGRDGRGDRERDGRAERALPRGARPLGELALSAGAAAHRSSTRSSRGREQQISALPSAGGSTGSGL